jgi:hypothetical protein
MPANISFGILAFHPLGWMLMLAVIGMEAVFLRCFLGSHPTKRNHLFVCFVANVVSGIMGFAITMAINGGWWLVIWMPWVTSHEASREQWPQLTAYMGVAYSLSVLIESAVVKAMLPREATRRVLLVEAASNLLSAVFLLAVFWAMGGVPGLNSREEAKQRPNSQAAPPLRAA